MKFKLFLIALGLGLVLGAGGFFAATRHRENATKIDLSHAAVVTRVQSLGRLETSSFTIEKIIEAGKKGNNAFSDFLFGDKLLMVAHGEVVAGFNLAALTADDVTIDGRKITIKLPAPQILIAKLDNEKTRVYDRSSGILSRPSKDLESDARLAAEQSIRAAACESGILANAAENAKKQVEALFTALDYTDVTVLTPENPVCN